MKGKTLEDKNLATIIREFLDKRPPRLLEVRSFERHSAVLIPLFRADNEYKVLFTKRTSMVETHKGQISFPGGAVDKNDGSFVETALREAYEETGIRREDVSLLGQIDDTRTVASDFVIHPFVGLIPYPYPFKVNSREVERLIEVPLRIFAPTSSGSPILPVEYEGSIYEGVAYSYKGDVIWGATARIMENFMDIMRGKIDLFLTGA
ncbi:MAG: CoA pyrophosphatase [Deltaproteobacteria bacterium]|nr:CoA pyrophosphatase [Deltaproteobacteria bacterium]